jgi:hypothetical protein
MTTRTEAVLVQLRRWCDAERGRRALVAQICECTPSTVSDWLSDPPRKQPTSEQILAVFELLVQPGKMRWGDPRERKRK